MPQTPSPRPNFPKREGRLRGRSIPADECDAFDLDVDDEPTTQCIFMANLSSAGPTNWQADPSNASILSEAQMAQPTLYDGNELLKTHHVPVLVPSFEEDIELAETIRNKMNEKINDHYVFFTVTGFAVTASQFHELSTAYTVAMNRAVKLKAKNSKLLKKIKNDDHDTMVKAFSKLERNNRVVYHGYLNCLKDTLDTLREIVEEARSKRPSDNNLDYACVYTKRSHELLENMSTSCLKADNKQDTIIATTPATRKKQVTFADPLDTSGNNPPKIVKEQTVQKTNILILHSTGVSNATKARRSQPKRNITHDRTLLANSVPKKNVEDHHTKNNSELSKKNRVDLSTSVRQATGRTFPLGAQFPLTRKTPPTVLPVKQQKPTSRLIPLGGHCPLFRPTALTSDTMLAEPQAHNIPVEFNLVCTNQQDPNCNWRSNLSNSPFSSMFKCRSFKSSFGYGDYVIGDSVIFSVYYVEGLGHNLFSVGPISSGLVPNPSPAIPYLPLTKKEIEILFHSMFDEYFKPPTVDHQAPPTLAVHILVNPPYISVSISIDQDASSEVGESSPNPTSSNLKRRKHRHSKQPFILEESPVDTMVNERTIEELLRTPTEGYVEAIVVPPILAKQFELKHNLINMMTSD
nr:hypothetical protein [Tanacetum cinerariifolium]